MPLICLFGPDGSGKSTLAKALAERLDKRGFRVKISWMRGTHTIASLLGRFISKIHSFRGSDNPYYGITILRSLRRLWQLIEFISMLPVLFAKFLLPSLLGYVVIAERYLPDFIVWVATTTRDPNYLKSYTARLLTASSMKAKTMIYVTAEPAELFKRREDMDKRFIRKQFKLYEEVAKSVNAFKLNTTNKEAEETLHILFNIMEADLRNP